MLHDYSQSEQFNKRLALSLVSDEENLDDITADYIEGLEREFDRGTVTESGTGGGSQGGGTEENPRPEDDMEFADDEPEAAGTVDEIEP